MRTFKFSDDKSYKFWNIELQGESFTVTFGRIGTKGQTQTKQFGSEAEARKAVDKLVAEKVGKGYVETTPTKPTTTENALEKALLDDPDDLATHSAYADWLSQQGDPRGEFIQVQLLLEDPSRSAAERKELEKRENQLLKDNARQWLGGLAPFLLDDSGEGQAFRPEFQLARGWPDLIRIPSLNVAFARALAKAPETRLLRRLFIEGAAYEEPGEYEAGRDVPDDSESPGVHALLSSPFLGNLRVFHLGEPMEGDYSNCHTDGQTAATLVEKMPRLEELYLLAHNVDLEKLFALRSLKNLRVLQIYHCPHYPLEILARNPAFANLTHLLLFPHALEPDDDEAYINLEGVQAIVQSKHLHKLTHLQLRLSDMGDEGCEEIVRSGILRRLKMLDVMHGRITDVGAEILRDCPDLRNLDLLELSYNRLSEAGVKAWKHTSVNVRADHQYPTEGDEMEYLWQGDME